MTSPDLGRGIGFLGGGHMGRALIAALLRAGADRARIFVAEAQAATARALVADFGITVVAQAENLPRELDTLVLAVKPQDLSAAVQPLGAMMQRQQPLVISVAAGLTVAQLQQSCGATVPIVRAMPNRPAVYGVGATGLFAPPSLDANLRARATAILQTAGIVVWVEDETLMDVVTALSGSGPAYFFRLAEALAAAGEAYGLPAETAGRLARATLQGAGAMAGPEADLATLRESVTSKGGTTAAALAAFTAKDFESVVATAVEAAVNRGRELASQAARGG